MTADRTITHSDGTAFSDGSGYASTPPGDANAWRLHGLAKAILQLAAGKRLTAHQHEALAGIVVEAEGRA